MENPDFLDLIERSKHAMYNYQGISGYCRRGSNILSNIVLVVIAGAAIAVINPLIILVLVVISYFIYKILDSTMEWTKVNLEMQCHLILEKIIIFLQQQEILNMPKT